jgi:hypothetical protein
MNSKILSSLVPNLTLGCACEVNLDNAAQEWLRMRDIQGENPLLHPEEAQEMIDWLHRSRSIEWSYGGYLEDRSHFLNGTYLDEAGGYTHLGIDINASAGTVVAAPMDAIVEDIFDDGDTLHGWGPRLILKPFDVSLPYLVLGHLTSLSSFKVGDKVRAGDELACIAPAPNNGYWFPHLHVQQIARPAIAFHRADGYQRLDGYGHPRDLAALVKTYPDPTWLLTNRIAKRDALESAKVVDSKCASEVF